MSSPYTLSELWLAADRAESAPVPRKEPETLVVWRREFTVYHRSLAPEEQAALEAVRAGEPFASVCDAFARTASVAEAAERALGALRQWITDGLFSTVICAHACENAHASVTDGAALRKES